MKEINDNKSLNDKIVDFVSDNIVWVFLSFIVVVFVLPRLFVLTSPLGYFDNLKPDELGNAIGGMTAPIIGLVSAFLIYVAFSAQVKANKELMKFNLQSMYFSNLQMFKFIEGSLINDIQKINIITKDTFQKTKSIEGKDAIELLIQLLNTETENAEHYVKSGRINEKSFESFLANSANYYINFNHYLNILDKNESSDEIFYFFWNRITNYHYLYSPIIDKILDNKIIIFKDVEIENMLKFLLEMIRKSYRNYTNKHIKRNPNGKVLSERIKFRE
jgi:hypothetical protein